MIQRLVTTLQALAAPVEIQLQRFPDFIARAEELALDFSDALMLVRDCPQLELTAEQSAALDAVDEALDAMSGPAHGALWTETAICDGAEWERVRDLAAITLEELGATDTSPAARDEE